MITLKGLHYTRSWNWLGKAANYRKEDPISAFICVWISFNHYYSTFALEYEAKFKAWSDKHSGKRGDKVELLFLIQSPDFTGFFEDYKKRCPQHFDVLIKLPVINMRNDAPVPKNITKAHRLSDLTNEDLFTVIYQIRNNLFHGSKDPDKEARDFTLCSMAAEFMIPLVVALLDSTYGEVLNVYDDSWQDSREQIRKLAEA